MNALYWSSTGNEELFALDYVRIGYTLYWIVVNHSDGYGYVRSVRCVRDN